MIKLPVLIARKSIVKLFAKLLGNDRILHKLAELCEALLYVFLRMCSHGTSHIAACNDWRQLQVVNRQTLGFRGCSFENSMTFTLLHRSDHWLVLQDRRSIIPC